jgi:multiple sugar transport system permease protein
MMETTKPRPRSLEKPSLDVAKKAVTPYSYLTPTLILIGVLSLLPIAMVIRYSFFDNVVMTRNPVFVGFANYVTILTDPVFQEAMVNTLIFTIGSLIAHLVLGLAFAMLLNTTLLGHTTKAIFRGIYILPWVFTATIIAVLWRLMLDPNGIVNYFLITAHLMSIDNPVAWLGQINTALPAVIFINIWSGYPFYMVSLLAGLQGIPRELYEAATIDGASGVGNFRFITLPQLRPIILSLATLDFIWTTQQFALIWMTTGGGPIHVTEVLSTYTYKLAFSTYKFSAAATSAVIVLAISIFVVVFYVRNQRASA